MMMMSKEVSAMPRSLAKGAGLVAPYLGLPDVRHVMGGFGANAGSVAIHLFQQRRFQDARTQASRLTLPSSPDFRSMSLTRPEAPRRARRRRRGGRSPVQRASYVPPRSCRSARSRAPPPPRPPGFGRAAR